MKFPILNKQTLAEKVELLVSREDMRYAEAVVHICEIYGIDPASMAKIIIGSPLKIKIERESIRLNTVYGKKQTNNTLLLT